MSSVLGRESGFWVLSSKLGYWGATGQKSSIRKMSSDFVESVERVPQRSQFAAAYGFWK
jgi:hypothetical protein